LAIQVKAKLYTGLKEGVTVKKLILGVEIGGTKHQVAIGNSDGELLCVNRGQVVLEEGVEGILRWIKRNIFELISRESEFGGKVVAIGVGFGGIVESSTGRILTSVQVKGWEGFKLKAWFEENFGLESVVLNDTVAGGYGEYIKGSGKGTRNFFYTNIGSGIGGVFILNGEYYDGQGYGAAYFGHTYVPDWTANIPGAKRKIEDLCSGWAIEKRLQAKGYIPVDSILMKLCKCKTEQIDCIMLEKAAQMGDAFALWEIERSAESFGTGLANVITLFSPDCIAIGGGVSNMGDLLLNPVRRYVDQLVFVSAKNRYRIVECHFGDQVVLVGSILFAVRKTAKGLSV
jgi:glucokinase